MNNDWYGNTQIAAYYIWEHSGNENALDLWYAAGDIASYFEQANILEAVTVEGIKDLGLHSDGYIWFVRNLAFRLHIFTGNEHKLTNWFLAEKLLDTREWIDSITNMASILRAGTGLNQLRSEKLRQFYEISPNSKQT